MPLLVKSAKLIFFTFSDFSSRMFSFSLSTFVDCFLKNGMSCREAQQFHVSFSIEKLLVSKKKKMCQTNYLLILLNKKNYRGECVESVRNQEFIALKKHHYDWRMWNGKRYTASHYLLQTAKKFPISSSFHVSFPWNIRIAPILPKHTTKQV